MMLQQRAPGLRAGGARRSRKELTWLSLEWYRARRRVSATLRLCRQTR